jgi:hypothetical protein
MTKKRLIYILIFFCITGLSYFAQQKVCVDYSFPACSSTKSTSSNMVINTFFGNTVSGIANSNTSIVKTKSILSRKKINDNTTEALENNVIPSSYSLEQNYPNPFNPTTQIKFSIPKESFVKLVIYNMLGEKVEELINGQKAPGTYVIEWNARNYTSGVYIYNLRSGGYSFTKKLMLLK